MIQFSITIQAVNDDYFFRKTKEQISLSVKLKSKYLFLTTIFFALAVLGAMIYLDVQIWQL